jgi:hypothetical protein
VTSAGMRLEMSAYISRALELRGRAWSPERVLREVRERLDRHRSTVIRDLLREDAGLYRAARRHFGSWEEALARCGADPAEARLRRRWSRFGVIQTIREQFERGERAGSGALAQAARTAFGSWRQAVLAAGLQPLRAAPVRWTRRRVIGTIRRRASLGLSLRASHVHDQAAVLWRAARRLFPKPWSDLVRGLGIRHEGRSRPAINSGANQNGLGKGSRHHD